MHRGATAEADDQTANSLFGMVTSYHEAISLHGPTAYTLYQQSLGLAFLCSSHMKKEVLLTVCLGTKTLVYSKGKDYVVYHSYKTVKCLNKSKSI